MNTKQSVLDDQDIEVFRKLWRKEFKEEITPDQARERGDELVDLFYMLARHKPVDVVDGKDKKGDDESKKAA